MTHPAELPLDELLARMRWVQRLARALVNDADQADDLAQDAWKLAMEQSSIGSGAWRRWFSVVMRNRLKEQWSARDSRRPIEAKLPHPDSPATPVETLLRLETQQALSEAVKELIEPYRSAILLRYFENWSVRQIAVREGVQSRAIESRLRRGRDMIRTQLERRGPAKSWASGLLLLARAMPAPILALRAVAAGLLFLAIGFLTWREITQDESPEVATGAGTSLELAGSGAVPDANGVPEFGADAMQRDVISAPTVSLQISVIDALSLRPLAGVRVHGEFLDASNGIIESVQWVSAAESSYACTIPSGATLIRIETDSNATHAGLQDRNIFSWADMGMNPLIRIRSERLRGEVLGRVLDLEDRPVPGAEVGVWLQNKEQRGGEPERRIPVAADGSFSMPLAMAEQADLFLAPMAPGHCALRHFRLTKERPENAYVEDLALILAPARELRVTVQDENGAPVVGAEVVIWPSQPSDEIPVFPLGQYEGRLQHRLRTGAAGLTPVLLLDRASYALAVRREGFAQRSIELPADETSVTIALAPALHLSGQVRTAQGEPAPGVRVIVEGVGEVEGQTDGAGRFDLACPSQTGEEVRLVLIPPAPHALQVIGPFLPQDRREPLDLRLERGRTLSARLIGTDGQLYPAEPGLRAEVSGGPQSRQPNGDAQTMESWAQLLPRPKSNPFREESAAELRLEGLPEGLYRVSFHGRTGLLAEGLVAAGAPQADLMVGSYPEPRATLTGSLRRAASGQPVSQFRVQCQRLSADSGHQLLPDVISLDCEAEDGRFLLQGVPPGWWQVQIEEDEQSSAWGLSAVSLAPDSNTQLVAQLEETFEGRLRIVDAGGQPAAGLRVRLLDHKGEALIFGLPARFQAQLDEQGGLFLQRLPRRAAFGIELSAPDGRRWTFPAGCLDPEQATWRLQLPR